MLIYLFTKNGYNYTWKREVLKIVYRLNKLQKKKKNPKLNAYYSD